MNTTPLYWWADFYGYTVVYRDAKGVHVETRPL
jgi:hypothetical protein